MPEIKHYTATRTQRVRVSVAMADDIDNVREAVHQAETAFREGTAPYAPGRIELVAVQVERR